MARTPKVGVYICHCGINIAHTVDVEEVAGFAGRLPHVAVARHYTYMCSDPGQNLIKQDIEELGLTHVVVAACSPLMHETTFRLACQEKGLNPYQFEMANIREQCSWVHAAGPETTEKAKQLVASGVSKAILLEPLAEREAEVTPAALVIGGGVAGIHAALDIADAGFRVVLVERGPALGGRAMQLHKTFPTLEPVAGLIAPLIARLLGHPRIEVLTEAEVTEVSGYYGNFEIEVAIRNPQSAICNLQVGAIIVATGYDLFDPTALPEFGYGQYPEVITGMEFERLAAGGEITVNGKTPQDVVFIHCVGSRDAHRALPYCSRVCCMVTARQAHEIQQRLPEANVTVLYMDVRAFGKGFEEFYDEVRREGVLYRRANPSEIIRRGDKLIVRAEDTLLGEAVELPADLVVLAVGMTPRADTEKLAALLRLSRSPDGFFMEAHPKLRPVDTATGGVFLAGCCQGPKDIPDTIAQARAAAAAAMVPLMRGKVKVEAAVAFVEEELCAGCGVCAELCTYGALALHPVRGVMTVNPVLCQGCGACAMACPSGAMNLHHFTFDQVMAQVDTLVGHLS
ncbi:MAG: CoB--CoM heterodisulfide reductase iron-sulfur subunit A family protein [Anaerolineae bacterium]|nr:CoB--CoM heterodisulfide reductase iron-sulfur subunit A family protein [Anaerolineae bacterium]